MHHLLYLKVRRCSAMRHWPGSQRGPWLSPTSHLLLLSDRGGHRGAWAVFLKVSGGPHRPGEDWPWSQTCTPYSGPAA